MRSFSILKLFIALFFSMFSACNQPSNNWKHKTNNVNLESNHKSKIEHEYSLNDFQRFQTFDEFDMKGVGLPQKSPFVYVKKLANKIYVAVSCDTTDIIQYTKVGNTWYNHLELEMWKRNALISKNYNEEFARTYDRLCYNDTILELRTCYMGNTQIKDFYIKTKHKCVSISLISSIDFVNTKFVVEDMLRMKEMYNHQREILLSQYGRGKYDRRKIRHFYISSSTKNIKFICLENEDILLFDRSPLGFYGIQPGIEGYNKEKSVIHDGY